MQTHAALAGRNGKKKASQRVLAAGFVHTMRGLIVPNDDATACHDYEYRYPPPSVKLIILCCQQPANLLAHAAGG